tara:strand:- start:1735 stop:2331 length:597 start_codon:yes stop_codon:yes gene_type:complete
MYNYVCNYKNCKYPSIFNKYCRKHYNIFFNIKALIIQKNYRRYKNNKIIVNIYSKLPDDLQYKIKKYINIDIKYRQYKYTINKIINTKIIKYFFYGNFNFTFNEISYHIYLLNKYHHIININILKYFYNIIFDIKIMITKILDQDVISILEILDNNYYSIINYLVYKDLDNNLIRECLYYITLYQSTYEKNYRIYITN